MLHMRLISRACEITSRFNEILIEVEDESYETKILNGFDSPERVVEKAVRHPAQNKVSGDGFLDHQAQR